jgi:hypothetical protein
MICCGGVTRRPKTLFLQQKLVHRTQLFPLVTGEVEGFFIGVLFGRSLGKGKGKGMDVWRRRLAGEGRLATGRELAGRGALPVGRIAIYGTIPVRSWQGQCISKA